MFPIIYKAERKDEVAYMRVVPNSFHFSWIDDSQKATPLAIELEKRIVRFKWKKIRTDYSVPEWVEDSQDFIDSIPSESGIIFTPLFKLPPSVPGRVY